MLIPTVTLVSLTGALALIVPRDNPTAGRGAHQPYMHGYNASGIKNWSASTDPYAKYLRSRVPLATRIPTFAATQANPNLAAGPQLLDLSYDYDNSFFTAYKYNDDYARRQTRFWQYPDIYGSWHGMPVYGTDTSEPEHGLINLPNPAWTDAAHRNGVKSLGCWFWPRPGTFGDYLEQRPDGSFPVADKLLEMAAYFGFDGYFINQEASISSSDAAKLMKMMQYWRAKAPPGFHIQWYDTIKPSGQLAYQNQLDSQNSPWLKNGQTLGVNAIFPNYAMMNDAMVETSHKTAQGLGLDPYQSVFHGTENEKYGYNPPYDTRLIFPANGTPRTGWGLFGSHFSWALYPNNAAAASQPAIYKRERQYWSGPNENPTRTGRTTYTPWPNSDGGVGKQADDPTKWDGVAHNIVEKSVIGKFPFVTRFNTGHGTGLFLAGNKTSITWNNAAIQDILPTWQWWADTGVTVDYDYSTAYDGGSSLKVTGAGTVRLFKTSLQCSGSGSVSLKINAASGVDVGLAFADAPNTYVWVTPGGAAPAGNGWTTLSAKLPYGGKKIAAVALRLKGGSLNIGEVAFTDSATSKVPVAPTGFKVDATYAAGTTAEVLLSWQIATDVWYYDISRSLPGGGEAAVGRIYDDVYYIKSLARNGEPATTLKLTPVALDGTRGAAATASVKW